MTEAFLSQDEIDALLGGEEKEIVPKRGDEAHPFDFSQIENLKKGGLPGLDLIFERWIKSFRDEIRRILPRINLVSKGNIYITRYNAFMAKIPLPSSYVGFLMKPLKENALLILDSRLVFTVVSVLFGGQARPFKVEGREFTKLELQVLGDFVNVALETFENVWSHIYPLGVEKRFVELNPLLARIVSPNEKVIIVEVLLDIDGYEAPMFFCFPQGMFLPIKDIIYSEYSIEEDTLWKESLQEKLYGLEIELVLEAARLTVMAADVVEWKVGDEIPLGVTSESVMRLFVGTKPKFTCKLGKINGKYAAMVQGTIQERESK